ncbi:hypothetical protein NE237_021995 [Protea cynaroides]|uniref:Uncharacterized protein n=1 Tax=Protea cynaroides TaxID=273540 RepID=A0A9Q0HA62_9MAGN|nr:hypothetical protein NE237_021995 [Protea cynaroides]
MADMALSIRDFVKERVPTFDFSGVQHHGELDPESCEDPEEKRPRNLGEGLLERKLELLGQWRQLCPLLLTAEKGLHRLLTLQPLDSRKGASSSSHPAESNRTPPPPPPSQ